MIKRSVLHLHCVGYATKMIEPLARQYVLRLGYEICTDVIHDSLETALAQFLRLPGDQAYLEFFQYTNVGKSAALLMILWVITNILSNIFIKNWLRLREHAHRHQ